MNLRELQSLTIDEPWLTFTYDFGERTVVKPIVRPDMIDRVADLCRYAGATIVYSKEEKTVTPKMTTKTHTVDQLLRAVYDGKADQIHGMTLNYLTAQDYILFSEDNGWVLTEDGANHPEFSTKEYRQPQAHVDVKPASQPAGEIPQIPAKRAARRVADAEGRELLEPSALTMRRGLYRTLRAALSGSTVFAHLVPVLDALEATDTYLGGLDGRK